MMMLKFGWKHSMMTGLIPYYLRWLHMTSQDPSRHTTYDDEIVWLNIYIVYMTSHDIPGSFQKYNLRLWNVPFQNLNLR